MSHASVLNPNQPDSGMKKKVMIAVATVVVGHIAVLGLLSQMKVQTLKPIHKDPVKVRFVKIQPPPAPPKPKDLPKPKEKPKPVKEVKIVKQQLPPPPKKVEKVQQVKAEAPKQVIQPPVSKPSPVISTTVSETKAVVKPVDPTPVAKPVEPAAPPADKSPKAVSIGGANGIEWKYGEKWIAQGLGQVTSDFLNSNSKVTGDFVVKLRINSDPKGAITNVEVVQSSGNSKLDQMVKRYIARQRFKPHPDDVVVTQPFAITLGSTK